MRIQPDEGISLRFGAKVPGPETNVCPVVMDFQYATAFGVNSANGYERLLLDAMLGDQTLFAHRDGVEATWSLYTPVLQAWAKSKPKDFPNYTSGSLGAEGCRWAAWARWTERLGMNFSWAHPSPLAPDGAQN